MDFGIFELLAELSIGLLGFTGVVSALGRSRLTAEVRAFRVGALVSYSSTSLLGSILPIVLVNQSLEEKTVWFVSSLIFVAAILGIAVWAFIFKAKLLASTRLLKTLAFLVFSIVIAVSSYLIYGLIFLPDSLGSIYLVALATIFGLGVYHFCMLVSSIKFDADT